jgi:hypothetical protein
VLVRPNDRDELVEYFASLGTSRVFPPIMSQRVKRAEISWPAADGHVDDKAWPRTDDRPGDGGERRVRVGLQGAITVLVTAPIPLRGT